MTHLTLNMPATDHTESVEWISNEYRGRFSLNPFFYYTNTLRFTHTYVYVISRFEWFWYRDFGEASFPTGIRQTGAYF